MKMSENQKAIMIQAAWRGRQVRKMLKRQSVAAIVLQKVFRGTRSRSKNSFARSRLEDLKLEETRRLIRLKRIRAKEKELAMIANLPSTDYLHFTRLRKDNCARIIQRTWRRTLGSKYDINHSYIYPPYASGAYNKHGIFLYRGKTLSHTTETTDASPHNPNNNTNWKRMTNTTYPSEYNIHLSSHEQQKEIFKAENEHRIYQCLYHDIQASNQLTFPLPQYKEFIVNKLEKDALALDPIHRRILDAYNQSLKSSKTNTKTSSGSINGSNKNSSSKVRSKEGIKREDKVKEGGEEESNEYQNKDLTSRTRAEFQELLRLQQKSSVMLNEYLTHYHQSKEKQKARLNQLSRCHKLLYELSHPFTLDEAYHHITHKNQPSTRHYMNNEEHIHDIKMTQSAYQLKKQLKEKRILSHIHDQYIQESSIKEHKDPYQDNNVYNENYGNNENQEEVEDNHDNQSLLDDIILKGFASSHHPTKSWYEYVHQLPLQSLEEVISNHQRAMDAISNKDKWSVLAAPHDITGPPIDITSIPTHYDNLRHYSQYYATTTTTTTTTNATNGTEKTSVPSSSSSSSMDYSKKQQFEEKELLDSLRWVAYASQGSKYGSIPNEYSKELLDVADILLPPLQPKNTTTKGFKDGPERTPLSADIESDKITLDEDVLKRLKKITPISALSTWLTTGQRRGTASQQEAQEVLGEVVGEQLLNQLSQDIALLQNRHKEFEGKREAELKRISKLTKIYQDKALDGYYKKKWKALLEQYNTVDKNKRQKAATKIQARIRGVQARKEYTVLRAERRVMNALQHLVTELSQPEIQKSSSPFSYMQLDNQLLQHITHLKNQANITPPAPPLFITNNNRNQNSPFRASSNQQVKTHPPQIPLTGAAAYLNKMNSNAPSSTTSATTKAPEKNKADLDAFLAKYDASKILQESYDGKEIIDKMKEKGANSSTPTTTPISSPTVDAIHSGSAGSAGSSSSKKPPRRSSSHSIFSNASGQSNKLKDFGIATESSTTTTTTTTGHHNDTRNNSGNTNTNNNKAKKKVEDKKRVISNYYQEVDISGHNSINEDDNNLIGDEVISTQNNAKGLTTTTATATATSANKKGFPPHVDNLRRESNVSMIDISSSLIITDRRPTTVYEDDNVLQDMKSVITAPASRVPPLSADTINYEELRQSVMEIRPLTSENRSSPSTTNRIMIEASNALMRQSDPPQQHLLSAIGDSTHSTSDMANRREEIQEEDDEEEEIVIISRTDISPRHMDPLSSNTHQSLHGITETHDMIEEIEESSHILCDNNNFPIPLYPYNPDISYHMPTIIETVMTRYQEKSCYATHFVTQAITTDISLFDKHKAYLFIRSLIPLCGSKYILSLLSHYSISSHEPPPITTTATTATTTTTAATTNNDTLATRTIHSDNSIYDIDIQSMIYMNFELPIRDAAILIGELSYELNSAYQQISPIHLLSTTILIPSSEYVHFCLLLRLLAGGTEGGSGSGRLKVYDLMAMIEDVEFNYICKDYQEEIGDENLLLCDRVRDILIASRYTVLFQSLKESKSPQSYLYEQLQQLRKKAGILTSSSSSHSSSAAARGSKFNTTIDTTLFTQLIQRLLDIGKYDIQNQLKSVTTTTSATATSGIRGISGIGTGINNITVKEALMMIQCGCYNSYMNRIDELNLQLLICNMTSFRLLQMKLQTWNRAVPKMIDSVYTKNRSLSTTNTTTTTKTATHVSMITFIDIVEISDIPLSNLEIFILGHLFARSDTTSIPDTNNIVNIQLLQKIKQGEFISMKMKKIL